MSIADILRAVVGEGLLAGSPGANDNRVKVATIRLEKDGVLERRKGPGRGYLFHVRPNMARGNEGAPSE